MVIFVKKSDSSGYIIIATVHAKFQDHRTSGSGEEYFFKVFTIYEPS